MTPRTRSRTDRRREHLRRHLYGHGGHGDGQGGHGHGHGEGGHGGLRGLFGRGDTGSVRRGNVRNAILAVLQDEPMHGYQIIQELERRTGGQWRPSAGSVYPTLQLLQDEGLLTAEEIDGRRTFTLTDAGRDAAAENPLARAPWLDSDDASQSQDLRKLAMGIIGAAVQVKRHGSADANARAQQILTDTRRRLYGLLAEDDGEMNA